MNVSSFKSLHVFFILPDTPLLSQPILSNFVSVSKCRRRSGRPRDGGGAQLRPAHPARSRQPRAGPGTRPASNRALPGAAAGSSACGVGRPLGRSPSGHSLRPRGQGGPPAETGKRGRTLSTLAWHGMGQGDRCTLNTLPVHPASKGSGWRGGGRASCRPGSAEETLQDWREMNDPQRNRSASRRARNYREGKVEGQSRDSAKETWARALPQRRALEG